jgi:hypothetical protein
MWHRSVLSTEGWSIAKLAAPATYGQGHRAASMTQFKAIKTTSIIRRFTEAS